MTQLHLDTLLALHGAAHYGLPLGTLVGDLRRGRHRSLAEPAAEIALRDLADRSFVTPYETDLGGKRWRITARGSSALQEEGLV